MNRRRPRARLRPRAHRGGGWVPLDEPGGDEPVRVDALLDRVAERLGGPTAEVVAVIFGHWAELVGESVAARSRPVSLRDGRLLVIADDGAWATQLRFLTADLVARITEKVGPDAVSEIVIRVDRDRDPDRDRAKDRDRRGRAR